jgi:hypothetical protein
MRRGRMRRALGHSVSAAMLGLILAAWLLASRLGSARPGRRTLTASSA